MRAISILFSLFCILNIISCASVSRDERPYAYLTDNSKFFLLPSEGIEHNIDMAQFVSAVFADRNYFFISWVKADENSIEMAFFNELGASIGELSYRDRKVHFSSTVIPRAALRYIKPEYIAADFQLCFYEPVMLGKALEACGLILEIHGDNGSGSRRILNGNEVIIEIIKTDNFVRMVNHLRGYTYTMEGDFFEIK